MKLELNFASFGWCNVPAMELQGLHEDAALKPAALRFDLADLASQPRIESSAAKAVRHFEQPFVLHSSLSRCAHHKSRDHTGIDL
jgi:hypothetical protein